jgi:hypothetical protein
MAFQKSEYKDEFERFELEKPYEFNYLSPDVMNLNIDNYSNKVTFY